MSLTQKSGKNCLFAMVSCCIILIYLPKETTELGRWNSMANKVDHILARSLSSPLSAHQVSFLQSPFFLLILVA